MWTSLDHLKNYRPICSTDATSFKEFIESERIFKFLAGLNLKFDPVRNSILGLDPLPFLHKAFAYAQNEESHRSAMLPLPSPDRFALTSSSQQGGKGPVGNSRKENPSDGTEARDKWCDHCNKPGHVRATC